MRVSGKEHTDMRPIDQVFGCEDWQTGEDVERRVDGVVCIVDTENGRVGREAGDDGVHDRYEESRDTKIMSRCSNWVQ